MPGLQYRHLTGLRYRYHTYILPSARWLLNIHSLSDLGLYLYLFHTPVCVEVLTLCCHTDVSSPIAAFLDGQQLKMRALETEQQHEMGGLDGNRDLSMNWDLHYPELGNTVEVITQYLRVVVWLKHESFLEDVSHCLQTLTCLHEKLQPQEIAPLCGVASVVPRHLLCNVA